MRGPGARSPQRVDLSEHYLVEVALGATDAGILGADLFALGAVGIEERDDFLVAAFDSRQAARAAATRLNAPPPRPVDDTTGLDAWRDHAHAIDVGLFRVRPPWLDASPTRVDLCIDPGHSFGSGTHASTQLALLALPDIVTTDMAIADVGCGSGILSVAAARLGAQVEAIDNDPAAVDATQHNAAVNDLAHKITVRLGTTPTSAAIELALVNVTIDVHELIAPKVLESRPSRVLVSGLLAGDQTTRCVRAYDAVVADTLSHGEWVALLLDL